MPDDTITQLPPFHKHPAYLSLIAEREQAALDCHDPCELAQVTAHFGRLIQDCYLNYECERKLTILLNDYARRAMVDGMSYGN